MRYIKQFELVDHLKSFNDKKLLMSIRDYSIDSLQDLVDNNIISVYETRISNFHFKRDDYAFFKGDIAYDIFSEWGENTRTANNPMTTNLRKYVKIILSFEYSVDAIDIIINDRTLTVAEANDYFKGILAAPLKRVKDKYNCIIYVGLSGEFIDDNFTVLCNVFIKPNA